MNVMPLITRLVLTRGMTWLQALIVSIKILYSEWQSMMSMAPKRWPQGVMKKSEYNVIRIWSRQPHESQYYKLPGFYRWCWHTGSGSIERVTDQELRMTDINRHVNSINSIRARNVSFNLQPNSRRNDELPMELLDKVNDREYLDMMDFNSFQDDEFPQSDPSSKRAICRKLRAMINDLDGLYQNAKYLQNKRFLTILNREKEILTNEANNYRPVATEDRLPFKSL